jgi:Skp family chaperone for outer membrane proteins
MTDLPTQVPGSELEGVSPETTNQQGGVPQGTPAPQSPQDVERLRLEYETKLAQSQQDLNKLKSSLQSREAQVQKEWQTKYDELQRQMREVRMSGMDENQRKQYEVQLQQEEFNRLQEQLQEQTRKNQEYMAVLDAQTFFMNKGVPADKLILNQGYDALVQSGWDYVSAELERARSAQANPPSSPQPPKQAPGVVTDKSTPTTGTTWAELRKLYGSDEAVYQLVEQGRLDPSVIPS